MDSEWRIQHGWTETRGACSEKNTYGHPCTQAARWSADGRKFCNRHADSLERILKGRAAALGQYRAS